MQKPRIKNKETLRVFFISCKLAMKIMPKHLQLLIKEDPCTIQYLKNGSQ